MTNNSPAQVMINQKPWYQCPVMNNQLPLPESLTFKLCSTTDHGYTHDCHQPSALTTDQLYCQFFQRQNVIPGSSSPPLGPLIACNKSGQLTDPYDLVFQQSNVCNTNTNFVTYP